MLNSQLNATINGQLSSQRYTSPAPPNSTGQSTGGTVGYAKISECALVNAATAFRG